MLFRDKTEKELSAETLGRDIYTECDLTKDILLILEKFKSTIKLINWFKNQHIQIMAIIPQARNGSFSVSASQ